MTTIRREGVPGVVPTDSRTAAENESQSQGVTGDRPAAAAHPPSASMLITARGPQDAGGKPAPVSDVRSEAARLLKGISQEPLTRIRYEHGGGRMYKDGESRQLVIDAYDEPDREFYFAAAGLVRDLLALLASLVRGEQQQEQKNQEDTRMVSPHNSEDARTAATALPSTDRRIFYGPHPCEKCGRMIVKAARADGGAEYNWPDEGPYPNTGWWRHRCDETATAEDTVGKPLATAPDVPSRIELSSSPAITQALITEDQIAKLAVEIHELNPDYIHFEDEVVKLIRAALAFAEKP